MGPGWPSGMTICADRYSRTGSRYHQLSVAIVSGRNAAAPGFGCRRFVFSLRVRRTSPTHQPAHYIRTSATRPFLVKVTSPSRFVNANDHSSTIRPTCLQQECWGTSPCRYRQPTRCLEAGGTACSEGPAHVSSLRQPVGDGLWSNPRVSICSSKNKKGASEVVRLHLFFPNASLQP
jgi:hypothetical protein